jgi:hypothetical protein
MAKKKKNVALAQFEASYPHFPARVEQNHKYHARMDSLSGKI